MVEHNLSVVASLSDRITVLARGEVLAEGDYATVSKDPRVIEAYIGSRPWLRRRAARRRRAGRRAAARGARPAGWYGESHVLHGIDFDVREGEVVTLLGRNGAGKTTTLKAIMGIIGKRKGSVAFDGRETIRLPARANRPAGHRLRARRSAASSRASRSRRT